MSNFISWLKNNRLYVILFLVVVIVLVGYNIWFRQNMDLIPEGAENVHIATTGYSFDDRPAMDAHVVLEKYKDGTTETEVHAIMLTDEGCRKLVEALSGQIIRATTSDLGGTMRDKGSFLLSVNFDLDGVNYNKALYCWNKIQVVTNWVANREGAKPKFDPSRKFSTIIYRPDEADALYNTIIEIIQNYAASDDIVR
jgi:hypothetical protein